MGATGSLSDQPMRAHGASSELHRTPHEAHMAPDELRGSHHEAHVAPDVARRGADRVPWAACTSENGRLASRRPSLFARHGAPHVPEEAPCRAPYLCSCTK